MILLKALKGSDPLLLSLRQLLFVLLITGLTQCASTKLPVLKPLPLNEYIDVVVIKKKHAEIFSGWANDASLIGYMPGSIPLNYNSEETAKNGRLRVWLDTSYMEETWMKREDVAFVTEFEPLMEEFPLKYMFFESEQGNSVLFFPESKECKNSYIESELELIYEFVKEEGFLVDNIGSIDCAEVWSLPNSQLLFMNPTNSTDFMWYDRNLERIWVHSKHAASIVHWDKTNKRTELNNCFRGRSVACHFEYLRNIKKEKPKYPPIQPY